MTSLDDDSIDFPDVERTFIRDVVGIETFDWVAFDDPSPRNPLPVPLSEARITLVATAGAHETSSRPLGAGGDAALVPTDAAFELSHVGYDTTQASEDPDVVYPVRTLERLAADGVIGSVAPTVISTMGFVPDGTRLLTRAVPDALERIHDEQAHLALLVPA